MSEQLRNGETDQQAFGRLYIAAFEARERLGLERGSHFFKLDHPKYKEMELSANAYDDMAIWLLEAPQDLGIGVRGLPYTLERKKYISRQSDGSVDYFAKDTVYHFSEWRDRTDEELDSYDQAFDFSETLPENVRSLIDEINEILPTLTIDQHDEEKSEEWFNETKYDRALQIQLKELEEVLHTAGGALELLQLAMLERVAAQRPGDRFVDGKLIIPNSNKSNYTITATFDPPLDRDDEAWFPDIIEAENTGNASTIYTLSDDVRHLKNYSLAQMTDYISYELTDKFRTGDDRTFAVVGEYQLQPDDQLPDDAALRLVKHLLQVIRCTEEE